MSTESLNTAGAFSQAKDLKNIEISEYKGSENKELIKYIKMIDQNIRNKNLTFIFK